MEVDFVDWIRVSLQRFAEIGGVNRIQLGIFQGVQQKVVCLSMALRFEELLSLANFDPIDECSIRHSAFALAHPSGDQWRLSLEGDSL